VSSAAAQNRTQTYDPATVRNQARTTSAPPPGPGDTAQWRLDTGKDEAANPKWRDLPAWGALLVLVGITALGCIIDLAAGNQLSWIFNWSVVIASLAAVLLVRRSEIFAVVIAPPIIYAIGSVVMILVRSGGLSDRRVLYDAASNWLVYGFPTMAAATAIVLLVAGIRLILHK
jgi:hypothetical protein